MQGLLSLALAFVLGSLIKRVILGLGIGMIVYTGVSALVDQVNAFLQAQMAGLPATVFQVLNILNVGTALNMMLAALTFHYTLVWTGKKIVFNPPS